MLAASRKWCTSCTASGQTPQSVCILKFILDNITCIVTPLTFHNILKDTWMPSGISDQYFNMLFQYVSFWEWFLMHRPCNNGFMSVSGLKPDSSCSQADVTLNHPHNNFTMCPSTQKPPHTLSAKMCFISHETYKIPIKYLGESLVK